MFFSFLDMGRDKYDLFSEIDSKDIRGIDKVFQPGILSPSHFFNPDSLRDALSELYRWGSEDIRVYFNKAQNITLASRKENENWWTAFQDFAPLGSNLPAGSNLEYWYGPSGKEHSSSQFDIKNPPYQAFIRMFGDCLDGFSCFVDEEVNKIKFSTNPRNPVVWRGDSNIFLKSAYQLDGAFDSMERKGYSITGESGEIKIILPERGALVGSLREGSSVTLLVKDSAIEQMVKSRE